MSGFRFSNFITLSETGLNTPSKSIHNTYKPGSSGVGATSISNRRAKNRLSTVVGDQSGNQFMVFNTLSRYNKYTKNTNAILTTVEPSAPTLDSIVSTNKKLTLNFTLGSNGGSAITDIEYSINNGSTWTSSGRILSPIVISNLTNGTSYSVVIKSKNRIGYSSSSNTVSGIPNVVSFTNVGTTSWTAPAGVTSVDYLIVGGGGGSGGAVRTSSSGGGGGGMILSGTISITPGQTYSITVGDGGEGGIGFNGPDRNTNGSNGGNSSFTGITALGGGGGIQSINSDPYNSGGSKYTTSNASTGGRGSYFYNYQGYLNSGGGGGGSVNGSNGETNGTTNGIGGAGGAGTSSSITGSSVTYGSGGGGGDSNYLNPAVAGTPNTGNGARGAGAGLNERANGAKGGSGIVILKY